MNKKIAVALTAVCASLSALPAHAASHPQTFAAAVKAGEHIFMTGTFGSRERTNNGKPMTCDTCHIDGGRTMGRLPNGKRFPSLMNAVAIFPRYNPRMHKVITIETQIRACVHNGLMGRAPAYGSQTMTDLVSYLASIARGQRVEPNGMPH
ncbi:MAG: cytochrome C [Gammaproteobacteria bacterium]|nr:cytochrome C [Gammaproteobacteria bacterium]